MADEQCLTPRWNPNRSEVYKRRHYCAKIQSTGGHAKVKRTSQVIFKPTWLVSEEYRFSDKKNA